VQRPDPTDMSLRSGSGVTHLHYTGTPVYEIGFGLTYSAWTMFMGCHSDSGFGHQVRSFYSNLLFGESFEPGAPGSWKQTLVPSTADANVTVEGATRGYLYLRAKSTTAISSSSRLRQ